MADVLPGAAAPVVDAPVTEVTPAPESPADQVTEAPAGEQEPTKPSKTYTEEEHRKTLQERLGRERRAIEKRVRAEIERDFYKTQLEERDKPQTKAQGEPKVEDYQDVREFVKDFTAWQLKEQRAGQEKESASQQEQRAHAERAQFVHRQLIAPGIAKYADFQDVVLADDVPVTQVMVAAASRLKNGAEVLYRLCQDRAELERIADLPDIEQAWEIKSYESKISAPPKPTKTPPPIKPLDGNAGAKRDWADLSTAEHVEKWLKRNKR